MLDRELRSLGVFYTATGKTQIVLTQWFLRGRLEDCAIYYKQLYYKTPLTLIICNVYIWVV